MNGNDKVAAFVRDMSWETVPEAVRSRARISLLDNLGAVLAGTMASISRISAGYAAESWRGDEATILKHGLRASAAGAAFANANAGNALDIDDDQSYTRGHPGVQLFPAVLAVGEKVGATGKELLEGLIVGYEVAPRMGFCQHASTDMYRACGSWGAVACAAAAARLLRLDHEQIKHALGIAEYHAPLLPIARDLASPAMVKHGIGWGAMTGVISAGLAQRGYTGIPSMLGSPEYDERVRDIGERYLLPETVFYKDWSSCAWGHPTAVGALQLVRDHRVDLDDIVTIRAFTFQEALDLYQGYPNTTEEAQFSVMWPVAALLVDGELGPRQILEERFSDPRIRSVVDRIEMILDPQIDALSQAAREEDILMYGRVEIELADGRVLDSGVVERGAKEFTAEQLKEKFRWLVGQVCDEDLVERLVMTVDAFEDVSDVREFSSWLR
jgi:2-methylcitrate dehydratase PrpD